MTKDPGHLADEIGGTARAHNIIMSSPSRLTLAILAFALTGLFSAQAVADVRTKHCSDLEQRNINQAVDFLNANIEQLKNPPFDFAKRKGQRKRIQRRIGRKLDKNRYECGGKILCRESAPRIGMHAFGFAGRKIRLCHAVMVSTHNQYCELVKTIAHEFGHSVGIPKDIGNHTYNNETDRVYQFGYFARDLCRNAGLERPLDQPRKLRRGWR